MWRLKITRINDNVVELVNEKGIKLEINRQNLPGNIEVDDELFYIEHRHYDLYSKDNVMKKPLIPLQGLIRKVLD